MGNYQLKGLKHGAFSILNVPTNLYSCKQNTNPMKVANTIHVQAEYAMLG